MKTSTFNFQVEKRTRVIYPSKRSRDPDGARAHTNPRPLPDTS